jgi:uracil-DNA glycosylase
MQLKIDPVWKNQLKYSLEDENFKGLVSFLENEYSKRTVYPDQQDIFKAFNLCPLQKVKVVILGQDPYHGPNQAHGLSFSVKDGVPSPPSLANILKEIKTDVGKPIPISGNLTRWEEQGVFLLNATLTVRAQEPGSHQKKGWEEFTDHVIQTISQERKDVIFLLWGGFAQKKAPLIDEKKHLILKAPHPSPLSSYRGFFGCRHFSKTNEYLRTKDIAPIEW